MKNTLTQFDLYQHRLELLSQAVLTCSIELVELAPDVRAKFRAFFDVAFVQRLSPRFNLGYLLTNRALFLHSGARANSLVEFNDQLRPTN